MMLRTILFGTLTVTFIAALTSAALAVPVVMPVQTGSPVQLRSCSATVMNSSSTPVYGRSFSNTTRDSGGNINYTGPPMSVDSQIPMLPLYASTSIFGAAEGVNRSPKTVAAVVYEFDVTDKTIAKFYGPRTGAFATNIGIPPYGQGRLSPWQTTLSQPNVGTLTCFVAYVQFTDKTWWLSPLAVSPPP